MRHKITFTTQCVPPASSTVEYSDANFRAMFSAENQALLLAGHPVTAVAQADSAWPVDIVITHGNPVTP